jgi:DNA-binding transcriptional LysR family regulator
MQDSMLGTGRSCVQCIILLIPIHFAHDLHAVNLKQLEHLLALADSGSFSRAATQMHLTQSALSRSIQSLEDELGGRLIDRIGKRNELTPLGLTVVARARRMVLDAADLRRSADLLQQGNLGAIRVGLGSGPGALLMTPLLQHMARHHPGVKVAVSRGSTELQLLQLRARQLDALVIDVRRIAPAADLRIEPLGELRAGFICRAGHRPSGFPQRPLLQRDLPGRAGNSGLQLFSCSRWRATGRGRSLQCNPAESGRTARNIASRIRVAVDESPHNLSIGTYSHASSGEAGQQNQASRFARKT